MTKIYTYGTKVFMTEDELKKECMKGFLWTKEDYDITTPIVEKIIKVNENIIRHLFTFKVLRFDGWQKRQFTYLEKTLDK